MINEEKWRQVPGFPDYDVSNIGNVRSWKGRSPFRRADAPKLMSKFKNDAGYYIITLCEKGYSDVFRVHQLVMLAFVGECPIGMEIRHLNGIRDDNRLENLKYGTRTENARDKITHHTSRRGSKHYNTSLDESDVLLLKICLYNGMSNKECEEIFNVLGGVITNIKTGHSWSHVVFTPTDIVGDSKLKVHRRNILDKKQIEDIKLAMKAGVRNCVLARFYNINKTCISFIRNGRTHSDVPWPDNVPDNYSFPESNQCQY